MTSCAGVMERMGAVMAGPEVRDVVRDVVDDIAPEELVLVEAMSRLNDATVVRRLGRRRGRREPLGFGLGEVVVLVTPVVWLALDQVARRIADSAADGAVKGMKAVLRRIFRRRTASRVVVPPLTPEQLGQVRRRVLEVAAQRFLDDDRATMIADAVVARLSLGNTGADVNKPSGSEAPAGSLERGETDGVAEEDASGDLAEQSDSATHGHFAADSESAGSSGSVCESTVQDQEP